MVLKEAIEQAGGTLVYLLELAILLDHNSLDHLHDFGGVQSDHLKLLLADELIFVLKILGLLQLYSVYLSYAVPQVLVDFVHLASLRKSAWLEHFELRI